MKYIVLVLTLLSAALANTQEGSMRSETIRDTYVFYDSLGVEPTFFIFDSLASVPLDEAGKPFRHWTATPHRSQLTLTCHDNSMYLNFFSNSGVRFARAKDDNVRVVVQTLGLEDNFDKGYWVVKDVDVEANMLPASIEAHRTLVEKIASTEFVMLTYYEFNSERYHRSAFSTFGLNDALKKYGCDSYLSSN